jgi:hypothetical protein
MLIKLRRSLTIIESRLLLSGGLATLDRFLGQRLLLCLTGDLRILFLLWLTIGERCRFSHCSSSQQRAGSRKAHLARRRALRHPLICEEANYEDNEQSNN